MDKTLKLWNVRTGALVRAATGHEAAGALYAELHAVAFSPGGKLIASAGRDGLVLVWDAETGKLRHRLPAHHGAALCARVRARRRDAGKRRGGQANPDLGPREWPTDAETGWSSRCGLRLAFAPDGKTLASGGTDWSYHRGRDTSGFMPPDTGRRGEWRLWDAATGTLRRTETETERVSSLAFAPDGQSLACGVGRDVRLYAMGSETPGRVITSHDGAVTSLAFTPSGNAIISGSHDRTA